MKAFVFSLALAVVGPSLGLAQEYSSNDPQYSALRSAIETHARDQGFSGVVRVSIAGDVVYEGAFAQAIPSRADAFDQDTPFAIASITKLFTAVLIMQEVEAGRIELEAPIGTYLPGMSGADAPAVTVHQLLNHTSGLADCYGERSADGPARIYQTTGTLRALIEEFCSGDRRAQPDESFYYNNGDYFRLGLILEEVTGQGFDELLQDRIIGPLELSNTALIADSTVDGFEPAYNWDREQERYTPNPPIRLENYHAGGAMMSSARDLDRFSSALFGGELINDASMELLMRTHPNSGGYGYGTWFRYPSYNRTVSRVMERYGRIWGHNTLLARFVDEDITVVVLANTNRVFVGDFQTLVGETLLD